MGKKLNNSRKKLKVLANPLGLLAENRSNKKAWAKGIKRAFKVQMLFKSQKSPKSNYEV